jgi:hypothetical protein
MIEKHEILSLIKQLPKELIYIIFSYDGSIIRERTGKYIKQLSKIDKRYDLLLSIPKPVIAEVQSGTNLYVYFKNPKHMFFCELDYNFTLEDDVNEDEKAEMNFCLENNLDYVGLRYYFISTTDNIYHRYHRITGKSRHIYIN